MPLVCEAKDWNHGVFMGSIMSSETTVASVGKTGVLRHDPFGMLPFCGYNMSDYFQHWIDMGKKLGEKAPRIFGINWFRTDESGNYIWPGFGENIRVLDWISKRLENKVDAIETNVGLVPKEEDINLENLDISREDLKKLLSLDNNLWNQEVTEVQEGQVLNETPDTSNKTGQGYTEMGKVYKDPSTGKLIMVQNKTK